jgi:myo-inositol-1(or 4)-monophosphatase
MEEKMSLILKPAVKAAKAAGKIHKKHYGLVHHIQFKSRNKLNLVTEVDTLCEKTVLSILKRSFPTHNFWGEESGKDSGTSPYTWLIDPLDGTTNYAHSYPFFCCSIALIKKISPLPLVGRSLGEVRLRERGVTPAYYEIIAGVIYDALRDECFTAEKGKGAFLNGKRLRVTHISDLKQSLVCTGFAYHVQDTKYNFKNFENFVLKTQGVRRDGSAAMNLAYTAAGRFEGFWERGIQAWDMAAGVLMVQEAGGKVTDVSGNPFDLMAENALASNGKIHGQMFKILKDGTDEKKWARKHRSK